MVQETEAQRSEAAQRYTHFYEVTEIYQSPRSNIRKGFGSVPAPEKVQPQVNHVQGSLLRLMILGQAEKGQGAWPESIHNNRKNQKFCLAAREVNLHHWLQLTPTIRLPSIPSRTLFFPGHACSMLMFPGQWLKPSHSNDPSRFSDNAPIFKPQSHKGTLEFSFHKTWAILTYDFCKNVNIY